MCHESEVRIKPTILEVNRIRSEARSDLGLRFRVCVEEWLESWLLLWKLKERCILEVQVRLCVGKDKYSHKYLLVYHFFLPEIDIPA